MSTRSSHLLLTTLSVLALSCSEARADQIKLTLTGLISSSNMTAFPTGQQATVSLIYDSATSSQSQFSQQAFFVNVLTAFSFQSGGYSGIADNATPFGQAGTVNDIPVWWQDDDYDGVYFSVASHPAYYAYTSGGGTVALPDVFSNNKAQSFEYLSINFEANYSTALNSFDLPSPFNPDVFNVQRAFYVGFNGGSFQIGSATVSSEIVQRDSSPSTSPSVPDTGTPALLVLTTLGALAIMRRRRAA